MRVNNNNLVSAQILNATFNSAPQQLNQIFGYYIQLVITGTPTGTFTLQSSGDANSGDVFPTNWAAVASSSQAVSGAGVYSYNVSDVQYNWVRLVYTDGSSGTSTAVLNATINTKGF